ncbi:MAG: IMP cyclohydrolase [Deltaproteobacteria bacterium]|jgi:phosphoribosylaminoimidazolecarboxamide formyltransferase/IMP cyclohydrolase|nr:IMP cyclohydrolase [Deltaproteobacteria bacterium]
MSEIARALISVSDKSGLNELATFLSQNSVEILSTGGTASALAKDGFKVIEVSEYTGSPEMLDGRVKTLHPKIHAGILHKRSQADHLAQMATMGWPGIDLVAVNLYPFERVTANPETTFEEAIENIDIGGPCLLRASAKNHPHVAVLCDPSDYPLFISEMKRNEGRLGERFRRQLAQKVFARTSAYDKAIAQYLEKRLAATP